MGRDSSTGIVTRYGLDGPGIRVPVGGEIFSTHPDGSWGPPSVLYNGYQVSFPGVKRPGRGVNYPPPSSAEVKERVELYLFFPSGLSKPLLGQTLSLPYVKTCQLVINQKGSPLSLMSSKHDSEHENCYVYAIPFRYLHIEKFLRIHFADKIQVLSIEMCFIFSVQ